MRPQIFLDNNCEALGTLETASNEPIPWKQCMENYMGTPGSMRYALLPTFAAVAVRTQIDNITLFWCPRTTVIGGIMYLIGLTISNLSSHDVICLPI